MITRGGICHSLDDDKCREPAKLGLVYRHAGPCNQAAVYQKLSDGRFELKTRMNVFPNAPPLQVLTISTQSAIFLFSGIGDHPGEYSFG